MTPRELGLEHTFFELVGQWVAVAVLASPTIYFMWRWAKLNDRG